MARTLSMASAGAVPRWDLRSGSPAVGRRGGAVPAGALRPHGGVVLCDIDDQSTAGEEMMTLYRRLGGDRDHRLIIASRDAAKLERVPLRCLHIPAPESTLRQVILDAAG